MSKKRIEQQLSYALNLFFQQKMSAYLTGGLLTVVNLSVSPDLSHANVALSWLENEKALSSLEILRILHNNRPVIKKYLATKLGKTKLRKIPNLHFYMDNTVKEALSLERLIDAATTTLVDNLR